MVLTRTGSCGLAYAYTGARWGFLQPTRAISVGTILTPQRSGCLGLDYSSAHYDSWGRLGLMRAPTTRASSVHGAKYAAGTGRATFSRHRANSAISTGEGWRIDLILRNGVRPDVPDFQTGWQGGRGGATGIRYVNVAFQWHILIAGALYAHMGWCCLTVAWWTVPG